MGDIGKYLVVRCATLVFFSNSILTNLIRISNVIASFLSSFALCHKILVNVRLT